MVELASTMPGFVSYESLGQDVGLGTFESLEALDAWAKQPEHVKTQQQGRDAFYDSYLIQVRRPARRAADQVRVGDQPQDRQGARADDPAVAVAAGG
jgi:heme-degrading monooxygenase HmoA